jgi:hypothetical protein
VPVRCRIDTPIEIEYYQHGGILPYVLEAAARKSDLEFSRLPGVRGIDFSGGISRPFLFPEDFLTLTGSGADSFWTLKDNSIVEGEEQGLHQVPMTEVDRILGLTSGALRRFSEGWNHRRQEARARATHRRSIWRSRPYRAITGGISLGLLMAYGMDHSSATPLVLLGAWVTAAVAAGIWTERRRAAARSGRPKAEPVDWVGPLTELQAFLHEARSESQAVYYYWSL